MKMPDYVRRRIYAEGGYDFSSGICQGAKLEDLDPNAIEVFRDMWFRKSQNVNIKTLSTEQLLRDCEAVTDDGVTYAALVLFGKQSSH